MPYRILRNSPHHKYKEGDVVDLDKDDAKKLIDRDPPLAVEVESEENPEPFASPEAEEQAKSKALKREAEQGAQMPEGPQAQRLTPEKQQEHAEKGLQSHETKQAQESQSEEPKHQGRRR